MGDIPFRHSMVTGPLMPSLSESSPRHVQQDLADCTVQEFCSCCSAAVATNGPLSTLLRRSVPASHCCAAAAVAILAAGCWRLAAGCWLLPLASLLQVQP